MIGLAWAIASICSIGWAMERQDDAVGAWLVMALALAVGGIVLFAIEFFPKRQKPLFARRHIQNPPSFTGSFVYGVGFYITVTLMPKFIQGKPVDWPFETSFAIVALFALGVPWMWFWQWRNGVLRKLPPTSYLVD